MHDAWTVLGGWGVEPGVLRPVFGEHSHYIDTNLLLPHLLDDGRLRSDWQERCAAIIAPHLQKTGRLAGWSTGAIIALGCCTQLRPQALVLISATLSFCRTTVFRHGMRQTVLAAMRKKLASDPPGVLRDFHVRCGLPDRAEKAIPWSSATLSAGLQALAAMTIAPPPAVPGAVLPLFVHGRNDAVIPFTAGEQTHCMLGGRMLALDASHACFVNNEKIIRSAIDHHTKEIDHESV